MSKQEIRDRSGKLIGTIESIGGGRFRAYSTMNRHVGHLRKRQGSDLSSQQLIGRLAQSLVALLYEAK